MSRTVADRASLTPGDLYLPGFLGDPDALPASASAWDFEFDSSSDAKRWIDADGATPTHRSNAAGEESHLLVASTHAVYIAAPPLPFTVTAKVVPNPDALPTACDTSLAVCSGLPASTTYRSLNVDVDSANTMTIGLAHWNSRGSWNNTQIVGNVDGFALQRETYLRWVVRSGSDMDAKFSFDGRLWTIHTAGYNPGFGAVPYVMLVSDGSRGLWDWIRFTRP